MRSNEALCQAQRCRTTVRASSQCCVAGSGRPAWWAKPSGRHSRGVSGEITMRGSSPGEHLGDRWRALCERYGLCAARRAGLLRALALGRPIAADVVTHARDQLMLSGSRAGTGLLLNAPRPSVPRFMPALTVTRTEVDLIINGLASSLDALRVERSMGRA